ncbi:MAG: hypothetical protein U5N86_02115 [Planctomycetota bacterium]|nr:hypothetical protein [Planctomycetota bacterium]
MKKACFVFAAVFLLLIGSGILYLTDAIGSVNVSDISASAGAGEAFSKIGSEEFFTEWSVNKKLEERFRHYVLNGDAKWLMDSYDAASQKMMEDMIFEDMPQQLAEAGKETFKPKFIIAPSVVIGNMPAMMATPGEYEISCTGAMRAVYGKEAYRREFEINAKVRLSGVMAASSFADECCRILAEHFLRLVQAMVEQVGSFEMTFGAENE